ncbi:response regulator [Carboxydothermus pertinax]|uniref:Stage 0 sporulation protein A homolog n=1 Tax=Carboxydothermus pertinax TaxID=870242 RepID=A0A1L8CSP2_9THEO|nr:response regulator [Carboxydothermus pertinax]GAV21955.1 response regulator [Carboxydothermus pertinax]
MEIMQVLVADDQPGIRMLLRIILEQMGFGVIEAKNGQEAIEKALNLKPGLIIMDMRMPYKSGDEAIKEIHPLLPTTDFIVMTAYTAPEVLERIDREKVFEVIAKPFDIEDFKSVLEKYLKEKFPWKYAYV